MIWLKFHDAVNDMPAMVNLDRVLHVLEQQRGAVQITTADDNTFTVPMNLAKFDGLLRQAAALGKGQPLIILEL